MGMTMQALALLPAADWLALALFLTGWVVYALFAKRRASAQPTILATTNRWRRQWMLQTTHRENRVVDVVVVQNLSVSPQFFASTTILIIGGVLAVLASSERATELVREIPFAARTSVLVFDLKLAVLAAVFVYGFFRFTWSLRQYTFGALLVAAAPDHLLMQQAERDKFADRAGRVMALAAEAFNDGLRAYYMAFAVVAWFFSAWAFVVANVAVLWVLYQREFRSEVLAVLREP